MNEVKAKSGGKRPGAGRKKTGNSTYSIRLKPEQYEKFRKLGASRWLSKQIGKARLPKNLSITE
jgi:hypothetical protein